MPKALGWKPAPDKTHVEKYPLRALGTEAPTDVPVVLGVNWYTSFDNPKEMTSSAEGSSWHLPDVEKGEKLGSIRGGHCFCLEPMGAVGKNTETLRVFYNQGEEGACVGFGHARAQSILRGYKTFDAFDLYDRARAYEHNTGEGSTCRSACAVLKSEGLREQKANTVCERGVHDGPLELALGVSAYRWATTAGEVCRALDRPNAQAVPLVNNWGTDYPPVVWLPVATLQRLLDDEGEADIVTNK